MAERIAAAFVPLLDCATLGVARELGFAEREGLTLDLVNEPAVGTAFRAPRRSAAPVR
jgi:ABC-type nitrate/sulfonate/bicarbonate transport system substrate-binding protein